MSTPAPDQPMQVEIIGPDGKPLATSSTPQADAASAAPSLVNNESLMSFFMNADDDETPEECFINDCRYGELEDVKTTLSELSTSSDEEKRKFLNSQNDQGSTALMMAACNDHREIVELLLKQKELINLDLQNKAGNTALHWSALQGRKEVCQILLLAGANADIFNNMKRKAFDEAHEKGFKAVCEVIAAKTDFEYCSPEPDAETDKKYGINGGA